MGGLEVKRYVGSCLISAPADAGGAALVPLCGVPLLVAPALSRLALHAHGAPLIQAGRGRRHGPRNNSNHQQQQQHKQQPPQARPQPQAQAAPAAAASSDSLNTASDESSGPSENSHSLPRIIKPRKRRKKDRKPAAAAAPAQGSSIVTLRPYVPPCLEAARHAPQTQAPAARRPPPQQQQQKKEGSKPPPKQQQERQAEAEASACQCRYCDPRGHIWDVRRHGYSAVLTAPAPDESAFASIPLFLGAPPAAAAAAAADSEAGFCSDDLPAAALRRSWSSSSAASSTSSSSAGDACGPAPSAASQGLQVSTEIVTSPNGHRDLEIRFYSCSPPGADADTAAAVEEEEEEAWTAQEADGGDCAEKLLGESLWANIVHAGAGADQ